MKNYQKCEFQPVLDIAIFTQVSRGHQRDTYTGNVGVRVGIDCLTVSILIVCCRRDVSIMVILHQLNVQVKNVRKLNIIPSWCYV